MELSCWTDRRRKDKTGDICGTCGTPDVDTADNDTEK
jgi:hypothetical protein